MTLKVPRIHFDTAALPADERFERWRASVPAYDVTPPPDAAAASFRAQADAWLLGDLVVTSGLLSAMRFARSAEKAKADGFDRYSLLLLRQGRWTGNVGGRLLTVGPGQVVLFDLTRPMEAAGIASDSITLGLARNALAAAMPRMPDVHGAVLDGAMGRLLADHLLLLVHQLPAMEQGEVPAVVEATVGVIAACLAATSAMEETPLSASELELRHRIMRHVDQQLAAPDLTPAHICRELACSRSALYRALGPSTGIAAYVRTRRLEAVHVLLHDPAERRNIADIARGFGFVSDEHFNKSFRRRFGYTPGKARRGAGGHLRELTAVASNEDAPAAYGEWTKKIG
jgi:AraC-like DNA-binding protein